MRRLMKVGEEISFLDSQGKGVILKIGRDGRVLVTDENGFENWIEASQCVTESITEEDYLNPPVQTAEVIEAKFPFSPGDEIVFLDGTGTGIVQRVNNAGYAVVENEDGFEEVHAFNLIMLKSTLSTQLEKGLDTVSPEDIGEARPGKAGNRSLKARKDMGVWEVDLHITELIDDMSGLEKYELLQVQLDHFENKLNEALKVGLKKVIFIHGRGKGKLKSAMKEILQRYPNCESLDGDYMRYGVGATEVRINYQVRSA